MTDISIPEHVLPSLKAFYACPDEAAAKEFLDTLPDPLRHDTLMCVDATKVSWLEDQKEILFPLYTPNNELTTLDQVTQLYDALRLLIKFAQDKAHQKNTPLQIVLGENHVDPDSLLISGVVQYIAAEQGIGELGIEVSKEDAQSWNGKDIPGLDTIEAELRHKNFPGESDPRHFTMVGGKSKNHWYIAQLAQKFPMKLFANDPLHALAFQENKTPESMKKREKAMVEVLKEKKKDLVSIYGYNHLKGLAEAIPDTSSMLFINTTHIASLYKRHGVASPPDENLAGLPPIPSDAEEMAQFEKNRQAGQIIRVKVPGKGMDNRDMAMTMAELAAENSKEKRGAQFWAKRTQRASNATPDFP